MTERVCWSTDPCPRSTGTNREQLPFSWSTAPVDRSFATVDRAMSVHVVHTGRPSSRPGSILACNEFLFFLLLISDLCAIFLMSLKNSFDFFYLLYLLSPYKNNQLRGEIFEVQVNGIRVRLASGWSQVRNLHEPAL